MSNTFKVGDKVIAKPGHERSRVGRHYDVDAGRVYTIASVAPTGNLRFAEKTERRPGDTAPPAHTRTRFELAGCTAFPVGSKVVLRDQSKWNGKWTGPMPVVRHGYSDLLICQHPTSGLGGFLPSEITAYEEPPRDFRVQRNGIVNSVSHKTQDAAAEAARKNLVEGAEFTVVELVTVAQYKVNKVLEPVA
ncbi:hypothetical protein [Ralstonia pseudosolanacearum]